MPRIERLESDIVSIAQCTLIDAQVFPHPSFWFGRRAPDERVWVAREDGSRRVVGFLASGVAQRSLHVHGLAVDPASRRQGIARALLRTAVGHAGDRGLDGIALCVSVRNDAAFALYESEGFTVTRRLRDYYSPRAFGGWRDALEMCRPLVRVRI